jgi:flavin-dependent dehydrogenase
VRLEPVIIGGGPAGCAAAIALARAGQRPILIERNAGPSHKVCGDFLSAETIEMARALGCDPAGLGAVPIGRVRLVHGRREAEAALPFPARSLSRRTLDRALLAQAGQAGAAVLTGQTVRRLTRAGGTWTVHADLPHAAGAVFLATGKHDLRGHARPGAAQGAVGLKMYWELSATARNALADATELTLFPGGYAGLQPVEAGRAALCIAVGRTAVRPWDRLLAAIEGACPRFAMLLGGARPLLNRPVAVAGVPYGFLHCDGGDGLFRIGDQAAVIPSLTGDGMAIALHSGQGAAGAWLLGEDPATWHRTLYRALGSQMRAARVLHRVCLSGAGQPAAAIAAGLFPALLQQAAILTRLRGAAGRPFGSRA